MIKNLLFTTIITALTSVNVFNTPKKTNTIEIDNTTKTTEIVINQFNTFQEQQPNTTYYQTNFTTNQQVIEINQITQKNIRNGPPTNYVSNNVTIIKIKTLLKTENINFNINYYQINTYDHSYFYLTPQTTANTNFLNNLLYTKNYNTSSNYYGVTSYITQNFQLNVERKQINTIQPDNENYNFTIDNQIANSIFYIVLCSQTPTNIGNENYIKINTITETYEYTPNSFTDDNGNIINEVIDIPDLIYTIITTPFSFISQAFNITLFESTPYAINISALFLSLIGILVLVFIIKKLK